MVARLAGWKAYAVGGTEAFGEGHVGRFVHGNLFHSSAQNEAQGQGTKGKGMNGRGMESCQQEYVSEEWEIEKRLSNAALRAGSGTQENHCNVTLCCPGKRKIMRGNQGQQVTRFWRFMVELVLLLFAVSVLSFGCSKRFRGDAP